MKAADARTVIRRFLNSDSISLLSELYASDDVEEIGEVIRRALNRKRGKRCSR